MEQITGEFRDGAVSLHGSVDWDDGTPLMITRVPNEKEQDSLSDYGINEGQWRTKQEELAEWVRWFDECKPLELTVEQQEAIERERLQAKEENIKAMLANWEKVEKLF